MERREILQRLEKEIETVGGLPKLARRWGVSKSYISMLRYPDKYGWKFSAKVLRRLGIRRVVVFEES